VRCTNGLFVDAVLRRQVFLINLRDGLLANDRLRVAETAPAVLKIILLPSCGKHTTASRKGIFPSACFLIASSGKMARQSNTVAACKLLI